MVGEALDHIEVALDPSSDHGVDDDADGMTGARVGTQVGMVWSGNLVTCELVARDGGRFRLRPAGRVDVVDVRSVTRSPTSLDATWIGTTGRPWAAAVVDLSLRGARVVLPVEASPRDRGVLVFGADRLPVEIRRMATHVGLGVVEVGTQFLELEPDVRRTLMRTVGSVRIGVPPRPSAAPAGPFSNFTRATRSPSIEMSMSS